MNKLNVKFQYCYGIKNLEKDFIFSNRTFSIQPSHKRLTINPLP